MVQYSVCVRWSQEAFSLFLVKGLYQQISIFNFYKKQNILILMLYLKLENIFQYDDDIIRLILSNLESSVQRPQKTLYNCFHWLNSTLCDD